jgi:hypothetical protein
LTENPTCGVKTGAASFPGIPDALYPALSVNLRKRILLMTKASEKLSTRHLKPRVLELLQKTDLEESIAQICRYPHRRVINPLFSFLYSLDESIHWRAVSAMGAVIARLAEQEMESARIIMRRFIWNLNDESGGIGWGSPAAMGETLALSEPLAAEYSNILISYIRPDGNYLELEDLQPSVLWGIGRLAHARPERARDAAPFLCPYLESARALLRGTAAWAAGALPLEATRNHLEALGEDAAEFRLYFHGRFYDIPIGGMVRKILADGCLKAPVPPA